MTHRATRRADRTFMRPFAYLGLFGFLAAVTTAVTGRADGDVPDSDVLRLGFSQRMFVGLNENDARASIRALAAAIAHESGLPADPTPRFLAGTDQIEQAVSSGVVDAIILTAEEFRQVRERVGFDRYLVPVDAASVGEEYALIGRRTDERPGLETLRDRTLLLASSPRMPLGALWLEAALSEAGFPKVVDFCRRTTECRASKAVLDVFFGKADACLVSREAFDTMVELNPQIGAQLAVIAQSPPVFATFFAVRRGLAPGLKSHMIQSFLKVHGTPAGKQALTIFQVAAISERSFDELQPTLALLERYERLRPAESARRNALLRRGGELPAFLR